MKVLVRYLWLVVPASSAVNPAGLFSSKWKTTISGCRCARLIRKTRGIMYAISPSSRKSHLPLYEAGAVYNPAWLELIEDARELRFMNWGGTNNASEVSWEERSVPEGLFWGTGVPVEYMVQLANEVGADPWFTMPHTADEEFIRNFATYVRDNLDPGLKAKVEYSNETWNFSFDQTHWLHNKAEAEWGVTGGQNHYYVKKAVETALIWEDVFGSEADARLVNVLATQARNPWLTERILEAKVWQENEPDAYVAPGSIFDELAVTTYFGNNTVE